MDKNNNKKCIIIAAGSYYGLREDLHKVSEDDLIIAADAGYISCMQSGLTPDIILGDFDSMEEPERTDTEIIRVPVEKDDTDTMLAIKLGFERGCFEFHIYGGTGGTRLDHTISNIQSLAYIAAHGGRGYMYDKNAVYTVIKNDSISIARTKEWGLVSIFCLGETAKGVDIIGAQYPLLDGELSADFPLGVSNHFSTEEKVDVSVKSGSLLISWELENLERLRSKINASVGPDYREEYLN